MKRLNFFDCLEDNSKYAGKISKSNCLESGEIAVVSQSKKLIDGYTNISKKSFSKDLPVILFGDHTACIKYIDFPFVKGADGTKIFSVNKKLCDPKFIYYSLKTKKIPSTGYDRKTKFLERITFNIPDIIEQRRIAKILDYVNSLKNKIKVADEKIEKLINSHFLKEVEKTDSENKKLGKFINFITSGGRGWSKYFEEDGKYFIRVADVINETIKTENPQFVIPPNNAEARRTKTQEGDVVLSITGSVGRSAVITKKHINSFISQHIALIRLDKNFLIPDYLVLLLSMEKFGQNQIKKYQYGQTKPGLNFEQISNFVFPIPPIKSQKKILEEINLIRKIKIKNLSKAQKIEELNKAIQEDIFK